MDYAEHSMAEVIEKERQFLEFLKSSKALLRTLEIKTTHQKWSEKDYTLSKLFTEKQNLIHEALSDNFNTPEAIRQLYQVVTATNIYMK